MTQQGDAKAPKAKAKGGGVVKFLLIAFGLCLVVGASVIGGGYFWLNGQFTRPGPATESQAVLLERGSGLIRIAHQLELNGVITDALVFRAGVMLRGGERDLKAGEYAIPANASMADVFEMLRDGDVIEYAITAPEGYTSAQIVAVINNSEILTGEITEIPAEGTLLPETYLVTRGMTRTEVLERMASAQDALMAELWPNRADNLPFETQEQAIILASIVEREAGGSEHDQVAGVFVNRLRRGMRLQADATIIYGINGGQPLYNSRGERRPLLRSELNNADNPYNTYFVDGLTPGPISNPGRAALEGVLNPADTNALYFVADGSGGHVFAATLAEHNRNVARWRQIERELIAQERAG